jgi:hypothetical protein
MQEKSKCNSQWIGHICSAKEMSINMSISSVLPGDDYAIILGWLYSFEVMSRFSLRHWRTAAIRTSAEELGFDPGTSKCCALTYLIANKSFSSDTLTIPTYSHDMIRLLYEVFNTIIYAWNPRYHNIEYRASLVDLRMRIEKVQSKFSENKSNHEYLVLAGLAALVYLERISNNFSGQSTEIELWTIKAMSILSKLDTCLCPFALFIFGCEAHSDEHRSLILGVFARMEGQTQSRNITEVKSMILTAGGPCN